MLRYKKIFFLLSLQLCIVVVCVAADHSLDVPKTWSDKEYVDPHSFYYDKKTQKESLPHTDDGDRRIGEYTGEDARSCKAALVRCKTRRMSASADIPDEKLSQRIVGMLLERTTFKREDHMFLGHINIDATESQLEMLREFSAGRLTLRQVDPILNSVLKAPDVNRVYETVLRMQWFTTESWHYIFYHKEVVIGIVTVLYLFWALRNVRWSLWKILSMSIPLIMVASFFITWWKLIEEAKIAQMVLQVKNMDMPKQCQPHKMDWMDKLRSWIYTDDCKEYYEAVMKKPELQVTPGQALTHMVAIMIYEPIILSGSVIATFLKSVTQNMPWYLSYPIQVLICIGFIPATIFFMVLLLGGSLNLGFGPFSFMSLRGPARSESEQNQTHKSKIDRRPIENVPNFTVNVHIPNSGRVEITDGKQSHNLVIAGTANPETSEKSPPSLPASENSDSSGSNASNHLSLVKSTETGGERRKNKQALEDKKQMQTTPVKAISSCDLAGGDSVSTKKLDSPSESVDPKVTDVVCETIKPETGSGDN